AIAVVVRRGCMLAAVAFASPRLAGLASPGSLAMVLRRFAGLAAGEGAVKRGFAEGDAFAGAVVSALSCGFAERDAFAGTVDSAFLGGAATTGGAGSGASAAGS